MVDHVDELKNNQSLLALVLPPLVLELVVRVISTFHTDTATGGGHERPADPPDPATVRVGSGPGRGRSALEQELVQGARGAVGD